jgi:hypothetical protein
LSSSEQQIAMGLLLRFYMNATGKKYSDVAIAADIPGAMLKGKKGEQEREDRGKNVQNFHNSFVSEYVDKIRAFLERKIAEDEAFKNRYKIVDNLINTMRGTPIQPASGLSGLLSPLLEDGDEWKKRIGHVYGGTWFVVRFAAHLGPGTELRNRNDPWMIYGLMEISSRSDKYNNDLPGFTILYKPVRDDGDDSPRKIYGNILSLKTGPYMILIGLEESTKHPLIVATDQNKDGSAHPTKFKSLILRKVENGSFISGYSMFIRSDRPWGDIVSHSTLGKVGLLPKSQLIRRLKSEEPKIDTIIRSLRNVPKHSGSSMLCL